MSPVILLMTRVDLRSKDGIKHRAKENDFLISSLEECSIN